MAILKTPHYGENVITSVDRSYTSNASNPITRDQVKNWLKLETSADDTLIDDLIDSLIGQAEQRLNTAIKEQDVTVIYETHNKKVPLPFGPVKSLTSVERLDEGSTESIDSDDYFLESDILYISDIYRIEDDYHHQGLKVQYTAGYETVPAGMKIGFRKLIASNYEDRQDLIGGMSVTELPNSSWSHLNQYKRYQ